MKESKRKCKESQRKRRKFSLQKPTIQIHKDYKYQVESTCKASSTLNKYNKLPA